MASVSPSAIPCPSAYQAAPTPYPVEWIDGLPVYYVILSPGGRLLAMTRTLRAVLGYTQEELVRADFAARFFPSDMRAKWPAFLGEVLASDEPIAARLPLVTRAGRTLDVEWRFWARRDSRGELLAIEGIDLDAASNRDSERWVVSGIQREAPASFLHEVLLEYVVDHVILTDAARRIVYVNRAFETVSGIPRESAIGRQLSDLWRDKIETDTLNEMNHALSNGHVYRAEFVNRHASGELYFDELTISPLRAPSGDLVHYLAVGRDATSRRLSDPSTGLQSRALLLERTRLALARLRRSPELGPFALLFIDIDRFKVINDTYGMAIGDQVILELSRRLNAAVRQIDAISQVGHLNRDEFAVLVEELSTPADAGLIAERIVEHVRRPIRIGPNEVVLSVSIGIASSAPQYVRPEELLRDAETAMSLAKESPTESCRVFDPTLHQKVIARTLLGIELRSALETDELIPYYQPIVDVMTGEITGAEALVRWRHPTRGLVSPLEFIPAAEDSGLIVPLGLKMMRDAGRQVAAWHRQGYAQLTLAVNVSARQFRDSHFLQSVERVIEESGITPQALKIELTESTAADDPAAVVQILEHLKKLGVQILMDDFGTGYSSLGYLTRLPLDKLKIDRSFIMRIPGSAHDSLVASTILVLAHNLGLGVVAEGVETEKQLAFLRELHCEEFQGYLFSAPVAAEVFDKYLRERYTLAQAIEKRRALPAEKAKRS